MLPSNLKNINFKWINFNNYDLIKHYIEMVNNIPNYYYVEILVKENVFGIGGPKWPIHVVDYEEYKWSSNTYKFQGRYKHLFYDYITILINKNIYQPYSSAKSAIK